MTQADSTYVFETPEPVDLKVELGTGELDITASETSETRVELEAIHGDSHAKDLIEGARVEQHGTKISVIMPKNKGGFFGRKGLVRARITIPHESSLKIETGSADLEARGRFAQASVASGSGDIEIEQIASGDLKAGSGDIEVETVLGSVKVKTGSGDVKLGSVGGNGDVMAGSGDVVLDAVEGALKVKTGSGDVVVKSGGDKVDAMAGSGDLLIQRVDRGEVFAKTGSGDVTIAVAQGTAAYLDIQTVTGDVTSSLDSTESPLDGDATVAINVVSGTGDVVLQRA
ncbi:MAG: DUF4097 family beta strand repeat-containing protein [Nocardioidaceae bacterium]